MTLHPDEQAREWIETWLSCPGIVPSNESAREEALIALLASVRQQALEEAAQLVGNHSVKTLQYVPLELPDLIRGLRAAAAQPGDTGGAK